MTFVKCDYSNSLNKEESAARTALNVSINLK
jgi:hypothetical protein